MFSLSARAAHALCVEKYPITAQGTSLGTTGYVDDFACHLLRAGVWESDRWPPSKAAHQEASTKAQSQEERKSEQPEEELNEVQTEGEEDP